MKKVFLLCLLLFAAASFSFGQIYRCEAEGKNGPMIVALHFVDYGNYQYLLYTEELSVFLDEENIAQLMMTLEKFGSWETVAQDGQVSLTKTIDSITFTSYYYNRSFIREPAIFYFIFIGGPVEGSAASGVQETRYTLFVDTNLDKLVPFRLSSNQVREFLDALSPEKLAEAREAYAQRKALEQMFE